MPLFARKLFHLNRWHHALIAWLGLVCAAGLAHAQGSAQGPAMVVQQVSATSWYVEGQSALGTPANQNFISNAAFVVTPAGVVVVDALGSPVLAERLLAEIRKITPQPVTHVIVTHYHADHIYGLQTFKAQGARILAHEAAREYLNSDTALIRLQASRETLAPWINA
jgi:glyoxylase-like metal-dependent hydrolase (beta-lactamase superfamily II)